jgi:curved DNA-binding protein CbpA
VRGPDIPVDDLYARLELPTDAAAEAIEIAWRALLKRHHPDVAGDGSLETAKLINIAHDWLSDPLLRQRYDRARGTGRGRSPGLRTGVRERHGVGVREGFRSATSRGSSPRSPDRRSTRSGPASASWWSHALREERPPDLDVRSAPVREFLARVASLTTDEIDRLELADTPPIAFVASIRRFVGEGRRDTLDELEKAVARALPPIAAGRPAVLDAATSYGHQLVLAGFLADELTDPFRDRVVERMTRGWEAAVDQARYGPNSTAVAAFLGRAASLSAAGVAGFARLAQEAGLAAVRWPHGAHPSEDEALRISVALADRDAQVRLSSVSAAARRAAAGVAGTIALRPAYPRGEFARLMAPIVALGLLDDPLSRA